MRTTRPQPARSCTDSPVCTPPDGRRRPSPRWTSRSRCRRHGGRSVADPDRQRTMTSVDRVAAYVDLDAVRDNVATLRRRAGAAQVMAVVKADGYGHGMLPCARASVEGGAEWLGVAFVEEALALRAAGLQVPVLAWLVGPGDDVVAAANAGIDISVSAAGGLDEAAAAAAVTGRPTRVHLKVDSGLGRAGAPVAEWPALAEAAAKLVADGALDVVGVWSHLAYADA